MSLERLTQLGAEVVGGIAYLHKKEVGRWVEGTFILFPEGAEAIAVADKAAAAAKAAAEAEEARLAAEKAAAEKAAKASAKGAKGSAPVAPPAETPAPPVGEPKGDDDPLSALNAALGGN